MEDWLLDMNARGAALTIPMLRDMANLLRSAQKNTLSIIGVNWPTQFIKRRPNLSTRLSHKYTIRELFQKTLESLNHGLIWFKRQLRSGVLFQTISSTLMRVVLLWVLAQRNNLSLL